MLPLSEEGGADVLLLEVEREPDHPVLELEHLGGDRVLEPVDPGDAVAHLQDGADLRQVGLEVVLLDPLLQDRGDLFWSQLHSGAPYEVSAEALEPAAHARVDATRADLEDEPPDQVWIDGGGRLDRAAWGPLDLGDDLAQLGLREVDRGRELDAQAALLARHQPLELGMDRGRLPRAALLGDEAEEVAHGLVDPAEELVEHARLRRGLELRVAQDVAQLRHLLEHRREVAEVAPHLVEAALLLGRLEEGFRVHPVGEGHG